MSKLRPIWGIDIHGDFQRDIDLEQAASQGIRFAFHKAGQGGKWVPSGLDEKWRQSRRHIKYNGLYYFLDRTREGDAQARHLMEIVRDLGAHRLGNGIMLASDFERYEGDGWNETATNATLRSFGRKLKELTRGHPNICYSVESFWNGGKPSGNARDYHIDATWKAHVLSMEERIEHWRRRYHWMRARYGWRGFGGMEPIMWQYTWGGHIGGMHVDTNACRVSESRLRELARAS